MQLVRNVKLVAQLFCLTICFAVPASAQDLGTPDSLYLVATPLEAGVSDATLQVELWLYNDPQQVAMQVGFSWDSEKIELVAAVASPLAVSINQVSIFYDTDLATTNANNRAIYAGISFTGAKFMPDPAAPKLVATYYFNVTGWDLNSTINFDLLEWDGGSRFFFLDENALEWQPVWKPLVVKDVNVGECNPPLITCPTPSPYNLCGNEIIGIYMPITGADNVTITTGPDDAYYSGDSLWFTPDSSGTYYIQLVASESTCSLRDVCDFSVDVTIGAAPVIDCPASTVEFNLTGPGQVCIPLPITGAVNVTTSLGTWVNDELCIDVTESGLFGIMVQAYNNSDCGFDSCTIWINVIIGGSLDQGPPDTLLLVASELCTNGQDSLLTVELWCFNDPQGVAIQTGFGWDSEKIELIDAIPSPLTQSIFQITLLYDSDLATSNLNNRVIFAGISFTGGTFPAGPERKLIATYYFSVSNWDAASAIKFDTSMWDDGSRTIFIDQDANTYVPIWGPGDGGLVINDCSGNCPLPVITCQAPVEPFVLDGAGQICFPLPITNSDSVMTNIGTWANNELCFYAAASGTYNIQIDAYNNCGTATCTVTVNVAIDGSVDRGVPDTLYLIPSNLVVGGQDSLLSVELYCYNDSQGVSIQTGFNWDSEKIELVNVVPSPLSASLFDIILYYDQDLATSNQNNRAIFAGISFMGNTIPASNQRKLLATYYFTVHDWDATSSIRFDTSMWDDGSRTMFIDNNMDTYVPIIVPGLVIPTTSSPNWRVTLNLQGDSTSGGISQSYVEIGVEETTDIQDMPPKPPEYTCYIQDWWNDGTTGPYIVDVRQIGESHYEWILELDPHGNLLPTFIDGCATLSWDPAELNPNGYYWLEQITSGGISVGVVVPDMRSVTEYVACAYGPQLYRLVWSEQVCLENSFVEGWQMVSIPVVPANPSIESIFPGYIAAWGFDPDAGYYSASEFESCRGYWLKLAAATTVTICGQPLSHCSEAMSSGWHMIGVPNCVQGLPSTNPPGILSALWGFDPFLGYVSPESLSPWQGYWAKLSAPGDILLDCIITTPGTSSELTLAKTVASSDLVLACWTDAENGLNRSEVVLGADSLARIYPSAPAPPEYSVYTELYTSDWDGPYYRDIRLSSDKENSWIVAIHSAGVESVHLGWDLGTSDDRYQMVLGHDLELGQVLVEDLSNESGVDISVSSEVTYLTITRVLSGANSANETLPDTYVLGQCYPNPFNPATEISFGLPSSGQTKLEIFNVLGQSVRVLLDEHMTSGWHTTTWDGRNDSGQPLSTGVYLYRLTVNDFADSKKMLLLK